ncbi:MAG TPA: NAD(+)/NADH kinase [Proteobacteria bacterium]|nr:NAD(+)/NADH kinase [Pseudomonadota bacterium]
MKRRVGLYLKRGDARASELAGVARTRLEQRGFEIADVEASGTTGVEVVLVLGGDGTLLSAARAAARERIPVLGVNTGGLGFLTVFTPAELDVAVELIASGRWNVEQRMMLAVEVGGKEEFALNDVVVHKSQMARLMEFVVYISGDVLGRYRADGLIVSTPTGSTAYSLSAGGPIVVPKLDCIVITPICPHTLTNRPVVVRPDSEVEIELVHAPEGDAFLSLDGQGEVPLESGHRAVVRRASHYALMVTAPERSFFSVLREKLRWQER